VAKAAAKETTEIAVKLTAKEILEQWVKQFGKKAILNWALILWWLWIIEGADMMIKEEPLDDDQKFMPSWQQKSEPLKQAA
jgi:hypothetical protein